MFLKNWFKWDLILIRHRVTNFSIWVVNGNQALKWWLSNTKANHQYVLMGLSPILLLVVSETYIMQFQADQVDQFIRYGAR